MIDQLPSAKSLPVIQTLYRPTNVGALAQVIVVNAWEVISHIWTRHDWNESSTIFQKWCKDNRIEYYARPSSSFSINEAIEKAVNNGNPYLIVEDLS